MLVQINFSEILANHERGLQWNYEDKKLEFYYWQNIWTKKKTTTVKRGSSLRGGLRGESKTDGTSKMERFVLPQSGPSWMLVAALDPPLGLDQTGNQHATLISIEFPLLSFKNAEAVIPRYSGEKLPKNLAKFITKTFREFSKQFVCQ